MCSYFSSICGMINVNSCMIPKIIDNNNNLFDYKLNVRDPSLTSKDL